MSNLIKNKYFQCLLILCGVFFLCLSPLILTNIYKISNSFITGIKPTVTPKPLYGFLHYHNNKPEFKELTFAVDFAGVYYPAKRFNHPNLYSGQFDVKNRSTMYPPFTLYIFNNTFCKLKFSTAACIHLLVQLLLLFITTYFILKHLNHDVGIITSILTYCILLFLTPLGLSWYERGQFDLYSALSILFFLVGIYTRNGYAMICSALFTAIKWTVLPILLQGFIFYLLFYRDKKSLIQLALFSITFLSTVIIFPEMTSSFIGALYKMQLTTRSCGITLINRIPNIFIILIPLISTLAYLIPLLNNRSNKQLFSDTFLPYMSALTALNLILPSVAWEYRLIAILGFIPLIIVWFLRSNRDLFSYLFLVLFGAFNLFAFHFFGILNESSPKEENMIILLYVSYYVLVLLLVLLRISQNKDDGLFSHINMTLSRAVSISSFVLLLIVGLVVFKDYGVHNDEYTNQRDGQKNLAYITDALQHRTLTNTNILQISKFSFQHGPIVEITLAFLQKTLLLKDPRDILFMRHVCCFFLFCIGIFFFYRLCKIFFQNKIIPLIGAIFLIISPRIFANSFYNTYDIPFLSFYIISIYTLLRWLKNKKLSNIFLHALACALLIATRPAGLIIPLISLVIIGIDFLKNINLKEARNTCVQLTYYLLALAALIVLFWPLLWSAPYSNAVKILTENINFHFPFSGNFLYLGELKPQSQLPWHYVPVWILITTPLTYCIYFFVGLYVSIRSFVSKTDLDEKRNSALLLLCFFLPLILTTGKLYDTWRHVYFIYPVLLLFSLLGISRLWQSIIREFKGNVRHILLSLLILPIVIDSGQTAIRMIKQHPFQYIYFNSLAGKNLEEIKERFDLDFWGLSYKQGLERLLSTCQDPVIMINKGKKIRNNINILPPKYRKRFKQVPNNDVKFLLTNYQGHPDEYPYPEYSSISISNAKVIGIYKVK